MPVPRASWLDVGLWIITGMALICAVHAWSDERAKREQCQAARATEVQFCGAPCMAPQPVNEGIDLREGAE